MNCKLAEESRSKNGHSSKGHFLDLNLPKMTLQLDDRACQCLFPAVAIGHARLPQLVKHQTLEPVIIRPILTGGNFVLLL